MPHRHRLTISNPPVKVFSYSLLSVILIVLLLEILVNSFYPRVKAMYPSLCSQQSSLIPFLYMPILFSYETLCFPDNAVRPFKTISSHSAGTVFSAIIISFSETLKSTYPSWHFTILPPVFMCSSRAYRM